MISTFGNLESTTEWLEVIFNIIVLTSGLILVTMLIGNIKVLNSFDLLQQKICGDGEIIRPLHFIVKFCSY